MPTLGKVDAVVTDPPYQGMKGGFARGDLNGVGRRMSRSIAIGDPWKATQEWLPMAAEIVSLGMIVFCTHHSVVEVGGALPCFRKAALLTWHKPDAAPTPRNVPRFTTEFMWCLAKTAGMKWDSLKKTMYDIPRIRTGCIGQESKFHPCEKPVELMVVLAKCVPRGALDFGPILGFRHNRRRRRSPWPQVHRHRTRVETLQHLGQSDRGGTQSRPVVRASTRRAGQFFRRLAAFLRYAANRF
ncbi:MAG: hypothetical protein QM811_06825 [Pirellulales bacterium]